MLHTLWSAKAGAGVTVCAVVLARSLAASGSRVLLVDLGGDVPAALGRAEPDGPGVLDWLATPDRAGESLGRLRIRVMDGFEMLPAGAATTWSADAAPELVDAVRHGVDHVVVDAGAGPSGQRGPALAALTQDLAAAGRSILVTRPCYLALRRAARSEVHVDGVVVVAEPGRSLDRRDIADVLGRPVLATVEVDPVVARSVDAGLLLRRPVRRLERGLRGLVWS